MPKPTRYAEKLMKALSNLGVRFHKEVKIGDKYIDIGIPSSRIDIEVDGRQHLTDAKHILNDLEKSHQAHLKGYDTVHITNHDIYKNVDGVADAIAQASEIREAELKSNV